MNLTAKQYEIVRLIWEHRRTHGIAPTLAELAEKLNVSKITVHEHIALLEKKKALTKDKYQSRSLRLTKRMERDLENVERQRGRGVKVRTSAERPTGGLSFPLLSRSTIGVSSDALDGLEKVDISDIVRLDKTTYILRVKGESMIEEGIQDGDYVLVEHTSSPNNGDIVVAVVNDEIEATLKFYHRRGNKHHLIPANHKFQTVIADEIEIQGRVLGVLRNYG